MQHLALAVRDLERARRFYETYFGFDAGPAQRYPDGVLIIRNDSPSRSGRRTSRRRCRASSTSASGSQAPRTCARSGSGWPGDGVEIVGQWDEPFYVSFKCLDPDGYVVEVSWEIPKPQPGA